MPRLTRLAYRSWLGIQSHGPEHHKKVRKPAMQFGAWNVRTLMDTMHSDRPELMTAIVAHELSKYTSRH